MSDETVAPVPPTLQQAPRVIASLSDAECRVVIARQRLCVVSVVDGGEPYAVPVYYGFDGSHLYLGIAEGRKTRALDANPRVYLTVTEIGPGEGWRSVALAGVARTLRDSTERQHGIEVLLAHHRRFRQAHGLQAPAPRRPGGGRVLLIEHTTLTGRSFGG